MEHTDQSTDPDDFKDFIENVPQAICDLQLVLADLQSPSIEENIHWYVFPYEHAEPDKHTNAVAVHT